MCKEKRRVPKLRFPGFTEDWEQRKLISLYKTIRNAFVGTATPYYTNDSINGYFYLESNNVKNGKINRNNEIYITKDFYQKQEDKLLYKDDIVIVQSGHVGHTAVISEELDKTAAHALIMLQNKKENFDSHFINNSFQTPLIRNKIDEITTGNTIKHILASDVKNIVINMPSFKEQKLISQLFKLLDLNITLHQRKLEHLNLKKKALLQKLFPKNGERYPELRFPGFTDAWEQRKLNEFLSVSNFKNTDNKYNKNNVLSVSGDYGIVNQIEFQGRSFAGVSVSNYGVVETGDIVYTKSPLKLNPYGIIKANRINAGIVSTLYAIYKTKKNCDSKFIEHYFNLDSRLNKYLKPLVNKGAKNDMKVSSENALIGEVCFPHVTEQKLIADFLDRLDLFITLHQRKLEHLQLQKKALLQQMFV